MEITPRPLFTGLNEVAAEYAGKHALDEWFPDISDPARTKIRQIIKNAFEVKGTMQDIVKQIEDAGISSEEHPRLMPTDLMPTDLRKPECPYCQNALKK